MASSGPGTAAWRLSYAETPELNTALQVEPHKDRAEKGNHLLDLLASTSLRIYLAF